MEIHTIENLRISENNVLVKLPDTYRMMLNNEIDIRGISIITKYEPSYYAPRYGTVAVIPNRLKFGIGGMSWKTDIEIQVGDTVWFNYLVCLMALGRLLNPVYRSDETRYYTCGEDIYVLLPYESLIVAKREIHGDIVWKLKSHINYSEAKDEDFDGKRVDFLRNDELRCLPYHAPRYIKTEIICLNSYVIGKQIKRKVSDKLIVNDDKTGWVKLLHVGNPVTEYFTETVEIEDVEVGDTVLINKLLAEKLENGMVNHFCDEEVLFFQRRQIYGKA